MSALTRPIVRTSRALTWPPHGARQRPYGARQPPAGRRRAARCLPVSPASRAASLGSPTAGGPAGCCLSTPVLRIGQEYVSTYLRSNLQAACLPGVIMGIRPPMWPPREVAVDRTALPIQVDRNSPVPLYFQVAQHLEHLIESGDLATGTRLENEIDLADQLRLSRPTM